jgi:hypothetical protein
MGRTVEEKRSRQAVQTAARDEARRQIAFLREVIRMKGITRLELNRRLGWGRAKLGLILKEKVPLVQEDLLGILEALEIQPADFFAALYPSDLPTLAGVVTEPLASDLAGAAKKLGRASALRIDTLDFARLYVERSWSKAMISALAETWLQGQPVRLFVAGQSGVGTTTEMSLLIARLACQDGLLPCPVVMDRTDLAQGRGAEAVLAGALEMAIHLTEWMGIELADRRRMLTAAAKPRTPARRLSGYLEAVTDASRRQSGRDLVLVVQGLEHLPRRAGRRFFEEQLDTLLQPRVSQIVVMPLSLLFTDLGPDLAPDTYLLPPVPVVDEVLGFEAVHPEGLRFFEDLIGRYLPLQSITEEARRDLVRLSAGIVSDMLAWTRAACDLAHGPIDRRLVQQVAAIRGGAWEKKLTSRPLSMLSRLMEDPYRRDVLGLDRLVAINAVVVQPCGGRLACHVHPAIRPLLEVKG